MSTRAQPLALDGFSLDAELSLPESERQAVKVVILSVLAWAGACTHDELIARYRDHARRNPRVPNVTDQRIRTATAQLARAGHVERDTTPGMSAAGHKASRWRLAIGRTN